MRGQPPGRRAAELAGQEVTVRRFDPDVLAVTRARRFAAELVQSWGHAELAPDTELVVSELATNAVLHTGEPFSVALTRKGENLMRIEVSDAVQAPPVMRRPDPEETGGRGIGIVAAIAQRWGVEQTAAGKTVWAELAIEMASS